MSMFVFAAALAFGAAPEPAPAPTAAPAATIAEVSSLALANVDPMADSRRVCVIDDTGAMMARKYCQTRAQWVAQGTDPLAAKR
jgi:hypothetical protein